MHCLTTILLSCLLLLLPQAIVRAQSDHAPLPPTGYSSVSDLPVVELANLRVLLRFGRTEEALMAFEAIFAKQPDWVPALAERAYVLNLLGRAHEARRDRDRAMRLNPEAARFYAARSNFALLEFIALYPDDWFDDHYRAEDYPTGGLPNLTLALYRDQQLLQLQAADGQDKAIQFLLLKLGGDKQILQEISLDGTGHSRQWTDLMLGNLALLRQDLLTAVQYYNDAVLSGAHWPELYYNRGLASILLNQYVTGCADLRQSVELGFAPGETMLRSLCTF